MKRRIKDRVRSALPPAFLVLAVLLGGASGPGAGAVANALLQTLSALLILYLLWKRRSTGFAREAQPLLWLGLIYILLVLLSLVPLPAAVWQQIPGRDAVVRGLSLIGMRDPALPFTLAPQWTLQSVCWLLPPLAAFLLVLDTPVKGRRTLATTMLVMAIVSVGLGVAQVLSGPLALKPYEVTNPELPVGFFANANHLATLLLSALPFSGYLAARAVQRGTMAKKGSGIALAVTTGIFLIIGIGIIGSLAGYGLLLVTLAATFLIYRRAAVGRLNIGWVAAVAGVFVLLLGLALAGPLQEQALTGKLSDQRTSRKVMAATTIVAIKDSFPAGTGLGTLPQVYRTYEDQFAVGVEYVNHTHNDYLEFVLEMGLPGLLLILAFLAWWAVRSFRTWRSSYEGADLGRAGSVVILVVLLHSLVDYPIRTSAIAVTFTIACALLIPPRRSSPPREREETPQGEEPRLRHVEAD